ncbi:NadN: NAD pyrophosphatase/5'-nucleotidase [Desulfosarcina variabilis str. Montpellier]|uniref:NAD nucleotidase n=1 Tax=Desulfosarcina variabilis TaxID=2300 RepID=UPI003AFB3738
MKSKPKYKTIRPLAMLALILMLATLAITGCGDSDDTTENTQSTVTILHVNDVHSHLDTDSLDLDVDGTETRCEIGGMARMAALIEDLSTEHENHLVLHAGDAVQGTLYYTLFEEDADAEVMNAIGFDAMCIGNHEFDDGDQWLADFIGKLDTPVISANIEVPEGHVLDGLFSPYITTSVDGETIGIIGVTIAGKTMESSQPSDEVSFSDEIASVQAAVDSLKAEGVGKIVLLSHYGYENVVELAQAVTDLDVIVDGDSHTLLGDFNAYGLDSSGNYPTVVQNADGDDVCIAQAWEYGKVLGELEVTFMGDKIDACSGTPHLILGDTFVREDEEYGEYTVAGDERTQLITTITADDKLTMVAEDETVAGIIAGYTEQVDALGAIVIGTAGEDLMHNRVPGHEYSGVTLELGSDIAPIVAKAFYDLDPNADICIQNAGGVRINVEAGDITYDTAYTLLPFSNTLFEIEMTGAQIKQVLEDAIENIAQGGSTGSFPYCYALKYDVDARSDYGNRLSNLEVKDRTTGTYASLNDDAVYVVVTNNYIAAGRDGYDTFATVQEQNGPGTDTYLDYALSFVNYVKAETAAGETIMTLPVEDRCIKSYISTDDTTDDL